MYKQIFSSLYNYVGFAPISSKTIFAVMVVYLPCACGTATATLFKLACGCAGESVAHREQTLDLAFSVFIIPMIVHDELLTHTHACTPPFLFPPPSSPLPPPSLPFPSPSLSSPSPLPHTHTQYARVNKTRTNDDKSLEGPTSLSSNDMDMDENSDWPLVEVEGEQGAQTSLDVIPATLKQAREILRLARVVKAEAEQIKQEAQRELNLARTERRDAELLKRNASEILKMAKEKLHSASKQHNV